MSGGQRKFELSMPQILGSALAAVTAAVAASYLGVAGTVIGAAVVSVASSVGTAIYTHYLKRTGDTVKRHTPIPWRELAEEGAGESVVAVTVAEPGESTPVRRRLPWVKVGVATVLVFGVSMGGILAYQAVAQRTVAEQVTGTAPHHDAPVRHPQRKQTAPPVTPRDTAVASVPAQSPTPTPTPTQTATKSPTPTPTPSETNSVDPSPPPTVTPTPTPPPTDVETTPEGPPPSDEPTPDDEGPHHWTGRPHPSTTSR